MKFWSGRLKIVFGSVTILRKAIPNGFGEVRSPEADIQNEVTEMIVLDSNEMRALERAAVRAGGSMASLMEKAGAAVVELAAGIIAEKQLQTITILCGKGNNGGDGFVVARFLSMMFPDICIILPCGYPETDLAKVNFNLVPDKVPVLDFAEQYEECVARMNDSDLIIDAIYGLGFKDFLDPASAELAQLANRNEKAVRLAVDIPSGIVCNTGEVGGGCFHADHTVTFTAMKPLHVLYPGAQFCGKVTVASVGIPANLVDASTYTLKTADDFLASHSLPHRAPYIHKGNNGTLLSICGSYGMAGAAVLSGMAALRCGVGLLRCAVPKTIYPIVSSELTEAVFTPANASESGTISFHEFDRLQFEIMEKASAVLIGCGLGLTEDTVSLVSQLIISSTKPMVIDADGINAAAQNTDVLRGAMAPVILTPHPGEMARLMGVTTHEVQRDRCSAAKNFAAQYNCTVVLKGAHTIIALPDGNAYVNLTGNNGLAKGGSGDVLAGMIASFLAQGCDPEAAAIFGVYYHGLAADRCAERLSPRTMLPRDLLQELPQVI